MPLLFAVTLFLSASLLFMVQPMVGKMVLPLLGGSPAVWNACMVFFQALLLLGYLYAHHLSTRYTPKSQWKIHMLVLAAPIAVMAISAALSAKHTPIAAVESLAPSGDSSPFLSVMALMTVAIGIPFFVTSTSAPLVQKWFAYTGHPSSRDPYFLYAASNAGSLISLLGYPLFIEPTLLVSPQTWIWAVGFGALCAFLFLCGKAAANPLGAPPVEKMQPTPKATAASEIEPNPTAGRIGKWIALAFVPSSLMLGVTFKMATDIASVPLLWVVPLALYLVTFIIAFGRVPAWFRLVIGNLAPVMILLLVFVQVSNVVNGRPAILLLLHILTFFAVAMMCHYELAHDRPRDVSHLTKYFLMMSVGGVLGGLFNALIAPIIFFWAPSPYEYYVTILLGCYMVPRLAEPMVSQSRELAEFKRKLNLGLDILLPALTGTLFWLLVSVVARRQFFGEFVQKIVELKLGSASLSETTVQALLIFAVPVMACFFYVDRARRFTLAVALILAIHLYRDRDDDIIHTDRTFFGILKVEKDGYFTRLVHGTTLHGTQVNQYYILRADSPVPFGSFSPWDVLALEGALAAWDPRQEPLTYYHRTGPVGAMFHQLRTRNNGADARADFAMVGLGAGSVSCYALPGQRLTFYEIDKGVKSIVDETDKYFSYTRDAKNRGATLDFRMGDARLKLKEDVDRKYALLLVDAFSSDAIPVHLLTKEAVELYMNRLTDNGVLALHISNKYISLEPVVAKIAHDLHLASRVWNDNSEGRPGKTASSWIVVAKDEQTLGVLAASQTEQILAFGTRNFELVDLLKKYGPEYSAKKALAEHYPGGEKLALDDFSKKFGSHAGALVEYVRKGEVLKSEFTLGTLAQGEFGPMFHPLKYQDDMPLWTDDYSDVLRVMMLEEVQTVRKFFGLPTLKNDEE